MKISQRIPLNIILNKIKEAPKDITWWELKREMDNERSNKKNQEKNRLSY
jgi:hypothetical protein